MDKICYECSGTYEFFQKYWPMYKTELEKAITEYQSLHPSDSDGNLKSKAKQWFCSLVSMMSRSRK